MHKLEGTQQVYVLMYVHIDGIIARPKPIVFDSLMKMYQHLVDLVMKNIDRYHERFAVPLKKYGEMKEYTRFINLWRHAQLENGQNTGFDAYWDEEPVMVL